MKIYSEIIKQENTSLALGFFDGVHIAHREIVKTLVFNAKKQNQNSAVISFSQLPSDCIENSKTLLVQSPKDKEIILETFDLDYFFELDFLKYKNMEAYDFLKLLNDNFNPKEIVVGFDFTFGKDKGGNCNFLKEHETEFGYKTVIIQEKKIGNEKISSSYLRKTIQRGDLFLAKQMLGRFFSVRNSVIKGNGVATKLGYPTANLVWASNLVKLPYGVYYGYTQVDRTLYPALISWGKRPTLTNGEDEVLEVHIYNFNKNIYGRILNVLFDRKVRNEMQFSNIQELKKQIQSDYLSFMKWVKTSQKVTYVQD